MIPHRTNCEDWLNRFKNPQVIIMAQKIEMDIEALTGVSLEKAELEVGQGYLINVEQVSSGIWTQGNFGDQEWISLSDGEKIYFFSSYEANGVKTIIGETEAPFNLKIARVQKTSKKTGNNYTVVVGEMEVVG